MNEVLENLECEWVYLVAFIELPIKKIYTYEASAQNRLNTSIVKGFQSSYYQMESKYINYTVSLKSHTSNHRIPS